MKLQPPEWEVKETLQGSMQLCLNLETQMMKIEIVTNPDNLPLHKALPILNSHIANSIYDCTANIT